MKLPLDKPQDERALPCAHVSEEHELGLLQLGREEGHVF